MSHSKKEIFEMINSVNHEQNLSLSEDQVKRVIDGAEKHDFDPGKISVRSIALSLKEKGEIAGKNNKLSIAVKCLLEVLDVLNTQKKLKDEELLEAVVPEAVNDKIRQLEKAHAASLKQVRLETGKAYTELNNMFLARTNQSITDVRSEYEERIELLEVEKKSLQSENREQAEQIEAISKIQKKLSSSLNHLEKENADLRHSIAEKESLETVIERLRDRLDAYEKAAQPRTPRRSPISKK
ncbi:hypothetical protein [Terasakiella pusilla]|uniref:hypothetical protein n=1 Tax=Terasakiella pusilla TaxID=64973 RepID=UPI003AA8FCA6